MRFSEKYLSKLLNSEDALKAVYELDSIISSAEHVSSEIPQFGMTKPAFNVHLLVMYLGEIGNGGHSQYFMNPLGEYSHETLEAISEIGLGNIKGVFEKAINVFPGKYVPKDWEERDKLIGNFDEKSFEYLGKLSKEIYKYDMASYPVILNYLKQNWSEVKKDAI